MFLALVLGVAARTVVSAVVMIAGLWSVAAIAAAAAGRFTGPHWWPLLSAVPIVLAVRLTARYFRHSSLRDVLVAAGPLWIGAAWVILSYSRWGSPAVERAMMVFAALFSAVVFIPIALLLWRLWALRLADFRLSVKALSSRRRFADATEMATVFRQLKMASRQARFIQLVVQRSMLDATLENEAAVRQLALEYENASAKIAMAAAVKPGWRDRLRLMARPLVVNDPVARARVTDALSILAAQLRARSAA